jgi:enoyl-CoA hydratase/carnithine racemase
MARLPRLIGRGRALEVLLGSDDVRGDEAALLGYVNRALPDAELDPFVHALASRISSFDKWAIATTKRLVNEASLPPDVEIGAGWDACIKSLGRPAAQAGIKRLLDQGFHKPGDVENRLGFTSASRAAGGNDERAGARAHAARPLRDLERQRIDRERRGRFDQCIAQHGQAEHERGAALAVLVRSRADDRAVRR